jgi:hypothetical protein
MHREQPGPAAREAPHLHRAQARRTGRSFCHPRWASGKLVATEVRLSPLHRANGPSLLANYVITRQRPAPGRRIAFGKRRAGGAVLVTPLVLWTRQAPATRGVAALVPGGQPHGSQNAGLSSGRGLIASLLALAGSTQSFSPPSITTWPASSNGAVREPAAELGCSARTMRRWVQAAFTLGASLGRGSMRVESYICWRGNVAAVPARRDGVDRARRRCPIARWNAAEPQPDADDGGH